MIIITILISLVLLIMLMIMMMMMIMIIVQASMRRAAWRRVRKGCARARGGGRDGA